MSSWLDWARRLQAIAQNGLQYDENPFHRERYKAVRVVAAEVAAAGSAGDEARVLAAFEAEYGHATPKVDVRGCVFRGDELLLVRGADDGLWTIPGGWAEVGESPREAVEKEVREEAGYVVRATKLVGVYPRDFRDRTRRPSYVWNLFFLCEVVSEDVTAPEAHEIVEVGFFGEDALPALSFRMAPGRLERVFEHHREPSLPADFD